MVVEGGKGEACAQQLHNRNVGLALKRLSDNLVLLSHSSDARLVQVQCYIMEQIYQGYHIYD
jgi:hypothetical protein